jgi:hypothetical protein
MEAAPICGKGRLYIQVCLDHRRYTREWGGSLSRSPESCLGIHFLRTRLPLGRITKRQPGIGVGSARGGGKDRGRPASGRRVCLLAGRSRQKRRALFGGTARRAGLPRGGLCWGGASHLSRAVAAIQATNCRPSMRAISGGILSVCGRAAGRLGARSLRLGGIEPGEPVSRHRAGLGPARNSAASRRLNRAPRRDVRADRAGGAIAVPADACGHAGRVDALFGAGGMRPRAGLGGIPGHAG